MKKKRKMSWKGVHLIAIEFSKDQGVLNGISKFDTNRYEQRHYILQYHILQRGKHQAKKAKLARAG